jgi:CRP-like cAMP-binding protein
MPTPQPVPFSQNQLLASLPLDELQRLHPHLEEVFLDYGQSIILPNQPIAFIYFPLDCLLSLVTVMEDGSSVESGAIGREGMAGIPVLLDAGMTPMQTLAQIPGRAVRVKAEILKAEFNTSPALQKLLYRYIHTITVVGSQTAACNRLHPVEIRLCRWLLMSSDGIGSTQLPLTQEFLATMLGSRRASVSEAAAKLQEAGLICYYRGQIQIVDRKGLETTACECYQVVKAEYDRLFRHP